MTPLEVVGNFHGVAPYPAPKRLPVSAKFDACGERGRAHEFGIDADGLCPKPHPGPHSPLKAPRVDRDRGLLES